MDVTVNDFYNVGGYSLLRCDLQLRMEHTYTVVRITMQYNVLENQMVLVITLFQFHSPGIQSIR